MKNILFGLLLISSLINGQDKTGPTFHLGAVTSNNAKFLLQGGGGYMFKGATIEGSIIVAPLDNHLDHPAYFSTLAGYQMTLSENLLVMPMAGLGYRMQSNDKQSLNKAVMSLGMRFKWHDVYLGAMRMDKTNFLSLGFGGIIGD